ncbi:MAG TPA: adenylate kinase [Planctomycetes bacterium]|nr:adenylate kinase [Planctomycetota bacterium]HIL38472.1 adenylate kinase [Planctomycetota bacterium]
MSQTVLILLGAPGAGKGTQATRLAESRRLPHISTGDLFRLNLTQGTELGKQASKFMDQGRLVPDSLVIDMLFDRVSQDDCSSGYLLDGFPRTVAQAEALQERLGGGEALVVIDLQVPDHLIVERIVGRLSCPECGAIFHTSFNPPVKPGTCDSCQAALTQRADDTAEVVQTRLSAYYEQTAPVADFYRQSCGVCVVDGTNLPDEVFKACQECVTEAAA